MSKNDRLLHTAIEHHKLAIETYDRREARFHQWFYLGLLAQSILFAAFTGWITKAGDHHDPVSLTLLVGLVVAVAGLSLACLWLGHMKRFKAKSSALHRVILDLENEILDIESNNPEADTHRQHAYYADIFQRQWSHEENPKEVKRKIHPKEENKVSCEKPKSKSAKYLFGPPCIFIILWLSAAVYSLWLILSN